MELDKTLIVAAPRSRVWAMLLDPKIMAGCIPGTQAVDVISDVEYLAEIKVKISFIAAHFKVRTKIVESRPPEYLRVEGTGEDSAVASSMTQSSEMFLTDLGDDLTEIRIKAKADVMGCLGSFGLAVVKTKADRMWDEFGANFAAVVAHGRQTDFDEALRPEHQRSSQPARTEAPRTDAPKAAKTRWWHRMIWTSPEPTIPAQERRPTDIYVELHRPSGTIRVLWPATAAGEAARWLKELD